MTLITARGDQRSKKIWYASYGSNLSYQKRFMCYIAGGTPAGATKRNPGCRDTTPPIEQRPITFELELYFAGYARSWGGAPAFVKKGTEPSTTYGRMYLITYEQFNDVVLQENNMQVDDTAFVPAFEQLVCDDEHELPAGRLYGHLLRVATEGEWPVITFTTSRTNLPIRAPSEAYLKIIVSGLRETYPTMTTYKIAEYLSHAEGVRGLIPRDRLVSWVEGAK